MSELYADNGGFRPLRLPTSGYDLQPGRQYILDSVARVIVADVYGLRNLPSVIECMSAKSDACIIVSYQINRRTGEKTPERHLEVPESNEVFRAFPTGSKHVTFTIDLAKVEERRAAYVEADLVKDEEEHKVSTPKVRKAKVIDLSILDLP